MKYSLRSLMIAVIVAPPLLAWAIWQLIPPPAVKRGSPADIADFLREIKKPYHGSTISEATEKCFVIGAPASRYEAVLAKADRIGAPTYPSYRTNPAGKIPTGTQYEFWCEGKAPGSGSQEGDAFVVVIVDGKPPVIADAWWDFVTK